MKRTLRTVTKQQQYAQSNITLPNTKDCQEKIMNITKSGQVSFTINNFLSATIPKSIFYFFSGLMPQVEEYVLIVMMQLLLLR